MQMTGAAHGGAQLGGPPAAQLEEHNVMAEAKPAEGREVVQEEKINKFVQPQGMQNEARLTEHHSRSKPQSSKVSGLDEDYVMVLG